MTAQSKHKKKLTFLPFLHGMQMNFYNVYGSVRNTVIYYRSKNYPQLPDLLLMKHWGISVEKDPNAFVRHTKNM